MIASRDGAQVRRLGSAALAGVIAFAVVCTAMQWLRADLDWMRAPLSFYLVDAHGLWVRIVYTGLSASLVLLGVGYHRALSPDARSAAPLLLFVVAGIALAVTAWAGTNRPQRPPTFEGLIHGLAAQTAFLCVTTAMLLQAWRMRRDPAWRGHFALAFGLAVVCFVAMWVHALWREAPRGLTQKAVIVLILAWLGWAAVWLRRSGAAAGAPGASG